MTRPGPTHCRDCADYYRTHRHALRHMAPTPADRAEWFARFHDAGHLDPADADEARVREAAGDVYFPAGVDIFMTGHNVAFDGRTPLELIAAGETARVLDWLHGARTGVMG